MTQRFVLLPLALVPIVIWDPAHSQTRNTHLHYAPVTVCGISFHHERGNPKYISVDAEYVNAVPHGLFLRDRRCPTRGLQIDFPDTGLDPSVALINDHLWEIHKATGTFQGMLKRDRHTGRLYLWLESVIDFKPADYLPEFDKGEPIRLCASERLVSDFASIMWSNGIGS